MLTPVISLPHQWPDFLSPLFTVLRYVAGLAIALAGIILGKAVAAERIRISSEDQPKFKTTWRAYFVVLLVISALGTMNTMFMYTEQSSVLGNVISKTRNHLQQLKFKVETKLGTPEYENQRKDIEQIFENFKKELRNPANCGFGAQANNHFRELQTLLPKLKPLALGSGGCDNVEKILSEYRDTVDKLSDDLPNPEIKNRFQQRKVFVSQLEKTIKDFEALKVQNASLSKDAVLPALTSAWVTYERILGETELISGSSLGLPEKITDDDIQGMGNITHIIPMLIRQFDNPFTYLIIAMAVLFDLLLVEFYSRYLHGQVVIRRETLYTSQPGASSGRDTNLFEE